MPPMLAAAPCKTRAFQPSAATTRNARPAVRKQVTRAAAAPVASAPTARPTSLRKYMLGLGWDETWVDTIAGEIKKRGLPATVATCEAAIKFLESLGISSHSVCNMASIRQDFLGQDVETQLRPVVDYIQRQGVAGASLVSLLEVNPGLLTYTVSADGACLEKGRARAAVEVRSTPRGKVAGVSYWREGASFETAPVAPLKPLAA